MANEIVGEKLKDTAEKVIKKRIGYSCIASIVGTCCLSAVVAFMTIGIVTICVFYVMNFFSSDNTAPATPAPAATQK